LLTIAVLIIRYCIEEYVYNKQAFSTSDLQEFIGFVIIGITVLVIAVPEGLPLAVTLALAYSVKVEYNFDYIFNWKSNFEKKNLNRK